MHFLKANIYIDNVHLFFRMVVKKGFIAFAFVAALLILSVSLASAGFGSWFKSALTGNVVADVSSDGLVGYWDFDGNIDATQIDSSGNGNNGIATGDVAVRCIDKATGDCLNFSVSSYVEVPNSQSLDLGTSSPKNMTISIWINPRSARNNGILMKGPLTESQGIYSLLLYDKLYFRLNGAGTEGQGQATSTTSFNNRLNKWTHVVVTYDGLKQKIYINGIGEVSQPYSQPILSDNNPLYIGTYYSGAYSFDGYIDEARIYNRVLRANEVLQLYNNEKSGFVSNSSSSGGGGGGGGVTCTDSDGGRNYFVNGKTKGYCFDCNTDDKNRDVYDVCAKDIYPGSNANDLFEYRCNAQGYFDSETYACPNGCQNGACVQGNQEDPKYRNYIIDRDIGAFIYLNDTLETGLDADLVRDEVTHFKGAIDGASALYSIISGPNVDVYAKAAVLELDHEIKFAEFDSYVSYLRETLGDEGMFDYDSVDVPDTGSLPNAQVLWIGSNRDKNEGAGLWISRDKVIYVAFEFRESLDINLFTSFVKPYLIKHPSTLIVPDIIPPETVECENSCLRENKCVPYGYRKSGEYCDVDGTFKAQVSNLQCDNSYECESNVCSAGQCVEINALIKENKGFKVLIGRVLCRLANIFDNDDYNQCIAQYLGETSNTFNFPQIIGTYSLADSRHEDNECTNTKNGALCVEVNRAEYRDSSSNKSIFVNLWGFTSGTEAQLKDLYANSKGGTLETITIGSNKLYRLENHELFWFTGKDYPAVVFTQEATIQYYADGTSSYLYETATGDNDATKEFLSRYPSKPS